jgi:hypothetical protein
MGFHPVAVVLQYDNRQITHINRFKQKRANKQLVEKYTNISRKKHEQRKTHKRIRFVFF